MVYIERRTGDTDSDVGILEAIAAELAEAPIEEQTAVANALISIGATELVEGLGLAQ